MARESTDTAAADSRAGGALVSTEWVAEHLEDKRVRLVESNEDVLLYATGHIPGAVEVDWTRDLNDPLRRDYIDEARFEALMGRLGITRDTKVVFYGDRNNWWATYAFWVFQLFHHENAAVMDGGRMKWEKEGRPMTREVPKPKPTTYEAGGRDDVTDRILREGVHGHMKAGKKLIDVRSPAEFTGERLHMEDYPNEGALRGGHIPGADNVPWATAANPENGTFKAPAELKKIYQDGLSLDPADEVVTYCRIGERSSHTWFVLKYLLGFKNVRNYDGSWTEWGNSVGHPIER